MKTAGRTATLGLCVALIAMVAAGCGGRQVEIASVREIGSLGAPKLVTARDGGASALIGGRILWTFGDTLLGGKSADGVGMRPNTAGLADPGTPLDVSEPVDAKGAPAAFLALNAEEQAYNEASGNPSDRFAVWPTSVIGDGAGGGIVFYLKLKVRGPLTYDFVGTGIARVAAGATSARRDPGLLFTSPEPMFDSAFVDGGDVVLYGASSGATSQFAVARAPLARIGEHDAYRYWTGSQWGADSSSSKPVLTSIPGAVTVSRNEYLQKYLAVHSLPLSNRVVVQVADRPEGPWSSTVLAFEGSEPGAGAVDYAGREHPELATNGGRTIVVSYYHPQAPFRGELRLVQVDFK